MSIQKRYIVSILSVIVLFAINLTVYLWGNHQQIDSLEELYRAASRQLIISSIRQQLNDLHNQIALLGEVYAEPAGGGPDPQQLLDFEYQLSTLREEVQKLKNLSEGELAAKVQTFSLAYEKLASSWRIVYQNFGVDNSKSITELSVHANPLNQMVIQKILPFLQKDEQIRVEKARSHFYQVAKLTDRVIALIFVISITVVAGIAYSFRRSQSV